ncbi:MAG: hypothetical protein WKG07_12135 [Hymenobacter sp.]
MGYYMGVFNFFVVLPQAAASLLLGPLTKHVFHDQPVYTLMVGGAAAGRHGLLTLTVDDVATCPWPPLASRLKTSATAPCHPGVVFALLSFRAKRGITRPSTASDSSFRSELNNFISSLCYSALPCWPPSLPLLPPRRGPNRAGGPNFTNLVATGASLIGRRASKAKAATGPS